MASAASALAYAFLFSLFPLLVFAVTLMAYTQVTAERVLEVAAAYLPSPLVDTVAGTIGGIRQARSGGLLSLGALAVLWSGSRAANEVIYSVNRAYDLSPDRPFWKAKLLGLGLTGLLLASVLVSLLLPVLGWLLERFSAFLGLSAAFVSFWKLLRWFLSLLFLAAGFFLLYFLAPNRELRLREVVPGTLFAAFGWQATSFAFSFYLANYKHYSVVYGSLGGVIALLVWLYLAGLILLLGGELNALLHARGAEGRAAGSVRLPGLAREATASADGRATADRSPARGALRLPGAVAGAVRAHAVVSLLLASALGAALARRWSRRRRGHGAGALRSEREVAYDPSGAGSLFSRKMEHGIRRTSSSFVRPKRKCSTRPSS